ncbi:dipeptide epimerase [Sphingopyxis fribergensis]
MKIQIDRLEAEECRLALAEPRAIARGVETHANVVRVRLSGGDHTGRGEAKPMEHYGDSIPNALSQIEAVRPLLADGITRETLLEILPPGGARNALDSALWDIEAKQTGRDAAGIAGLPALRKIVTVYTIPLKAPAEAALVAARERSRPLIKVKLGHFSEDRARLEAIRKAAPGARLIVDANEGWSLAQLLEIAPIARDLGVELIEQPLRAADDAQLDGIDVGIPLCADESCHTRASLDELGSRYAYVNIKLDKSGGLTEALALAREADARGYGVMVGCTNGATLGIAPAYLLGQLCSYCDLDAPLFLAGREEEELAYDGSELGWSESRTWGRP